MLIPDRVRAGYVDTTADLGHYLEVCQLQPADTEFFSSLVERRVAVARFVLVHGAFAGAWSWEPLVGALEAAGHTAEAFDLPGSGDDPMPVAEVTLGAYCERLSEVLAARAEPAVLVPTAWAASSRRRSPRARAIAWRRWSTWRRSCPSTARACGT